MSGLDEIFLAYDVRGKVGTNLTEEVAFQIGKGFADWLPTSGSVAVGRDMRPDSEQLASSLIKGLTEQGRNVIDIGQVTSDMIYFTVGKLELAGGMMVTASHNPGDYNGIKFCREKAGAVGIESGLTDIKDIIVNNAFKPTGLVGQVTSRDTSTDWIKHVVSFVDPSRLKPLMLVVDAGNGMAGLTFTKLYEFIPLNVTEMYFEPDGTFPNHIANPLEPKNLVDIKAEMSNKRYDAGIAFDGDGDRAVLLDENGETLSGTVLTAILSEYFLEQEPGATILLNAICGQAAFDSIAQGSGRAIRTKVGHSFIKAKMREYDALFAGEHSGHYYFRNNYSADSGLIAAVIVLYVMSVKDLPLSKLAEPYRNAYVSINEINFEVTNKNEVLDKIKDSFDASDLDDLDGITVRQDSSWFNVRPSNTEPLLRLNAEAKDSQQLESIVKKATSIIKGQEV